MQTEKKTDIFDIMASTPEEATKLFWVEFWKQTPDLQVIEDILAYSHIDVNLQDELGWSALMVASDRGNEKCVELLLKHPMIDVNLQRKGGYMALMYAVSWGNEKVIELLLNHPKIVVNVQDEYGRTAWDFVNNSSIRQQFPQLNPNA
jgi:serine/threonine-protein phosphatase 6 regulatory ankyrin repeat subunit B